MTETQKLTFDELIHHWALEKPDQVALEQDGDALTFSQLEERSRRIVSMLRTHGLAKGDSPPGSWRWFAGWARGAAKARTSGRQARPAERDELAWCAPVPPGTF